MKRFEYKKKHLDFLKAGYLKMHTRDLTKAFNKKFGTKKTEVCIRSALSNRRITCGRPHGKRLITRYRLFNDEQTRFLKSNYPGRSIAQITALYNLAFRTDVTQAQIKTGLGNRGIKSGRTGHFPKGHKSWNKGTKGLTGANRTSFKEGHVPARHRPIGSERICSKQGYVLIKIPEINPYTGFFGYWKHKHTHMWEQENGPVPDGYVVILKDADKLNVVPENLALVSRAELLMLNRIGYKDAPNELKPSILATVRLEVKAFALEKTIRKAK